MANALTGTLGRRDPRAHCIDVASAGSSNLRRDAGSRTAACVRATSTVRSGDSSTPCAKQLDAGALAVTRRAASPSGCAWSPAAHASSR
jgi:hypothetical protein